MPISPIEDMKQFKSDTAYKLFLFLHQVITKPLNEFGLKSHHFIIKHRKKLVPTGHQTLFDGFKRII